MTNPDTISNWDDSAVQETVAAVAPMEPGEPGHPTRSTLEEVAWTKLPEYPPDHLALLATSGRLLLGQTSGMGSEGIAVLQVRTADGTVEETPFIVKAGEASPNEGVYVVAAFIGNAAASEVRGAVVRDDGLYGRQEVPFPLYYIEIGRAHV